MCLGCNKDGEGIQCIWDVTRMGGGCTWDVTKIEGGGYLECNKDWGRRLR
jgi:hypothetical protein